MFNDDLLFKFRNKEYGAYKIRKLYKKTVLISLFISSITVIIIFLIPLIVSLNRQLKNEWVFKGQIVPAELIQLEYIKPPKQDEIKSLQSKAPEIKVLKVSGDSIVKTDSSKNKQLSSLDKDSTLKATESKIKTDDARLKEEAVFSCGGDPVKFRNWFYQNFKFPDSLKSKKIEGKLLVQFTVDKRGLVDSVKIINSVYPAIDNAAKQTILSAPRWTPCVINGKQVKQICIFPIYILARK